MGVPEFSFFTIWSVEEAYAANTRSFIMEATATKKLSLCLAFLTLGREGLMVRNFPLRELAVKRKRLKILSRHTGENQPIYNLEPEALVISRVAEHHATSCTHFLKRGKGILH